MSPQQIKHFLDYDVHHIVETFLSPVAQKISFLQCGHEYEKKHPFLEAVVDRVLFNIKHYDKKIMGVGKIGVLRLSGPIIYTQTIFSMLGKYKYRIINSRKQGLVYSIYEEIGKKNFHTLSGDHYSKQKEPIIV